MYTCLCTRACVCVCVCVREREREQKCLPITKVFMYMCTQGAPPEYTSLKKWRARSPYCGEHTENSKAVMPE